MSTNNTHSSTTVTSTITEYPVGYCKPPKTGQFPPGQSGNPKGRPKGSQNFTTILEKELNNKIQIVENGQQKTITLQEALLRRHLGKAVNGDNSAFKTITSMILKHLSREFSYKDLSESERKKFRPTLHHTITVIEPVEIVEYADEVAAAEAQDKKST